jgi:hypothetical protein
MKYVSLFLQGSIYLTVIGLGFYVHPVFGWVVIGALFLNSN